MTRKATPTEQIASGLFGGLAGALALVVLEGWIELASLTLYTLSVAMLARGMYRFGGDASDV